MASVSVDSSFHDQKHYVKAQLAQIRDDLEDEMRTELLAVLEKIKALAIELCPKDTGSLASSVSLEEGTLQAGDFYNGSIFAGSDDIINPKTKRPTSEYVLFVHEGHLMPDGSFYEGVPFLTEAIMAYEAELDEAVNRAMKELLESEPSSSDITSQSD
jgi:hypothetical protein